MDRPNDLPLSAVIGVYEGLTADRPYRAALEPEQALAILNGDVE
jgi:HD-GYP domain-containing protein (c-di-GMP phosphodiesterase class II)